MGLARAAGWALASEASAGKMSTARLSRFMGVDLLSYKDAPTCPKSLLFSDERAFCTMNSRRSRPAGGWLHTNYETLLITRSEEHVAVVTLNRPERSNALNTLMGRDLRDVFRGFYVDSLGIRCIVLTGA